MDFFQFMLHVFGGVALLAGIFTGTGISWLYLGWRLRVHGLTSRQ
jgi:hypothetical protein